MTTRISERGPLPLVEATRTAPRVTPSTSQPFRAVMQAGARAVVDSAEGAVRRLPGGPVLAAAFRSEPPGVATSQSRLTTTSPGGPPLAAEGPVSSHDPTTSPGADPMGGEMALNTEQNMYYLKLQQEISAESREYTALSNVLKARHDMVKNAIGNLR